MLTAVGNAVLFFAVSVVVVYVLLIIDDLMHPAYKLWTEVERRNEAVALTVAGKLIGLGIIAIQASQHNEGLANCILWIVIGGALQIAGYWIFELATPRLNVGKEIAAGNRAVGLVSLGMSVGLSLVIAGCIV